MSEIFQFFFFSVLFANICASKNFFGQERTLATFGTSTRLNFMPLRADESINTHPISRQKTTHTHTHYFPLVDEIKKGASERASVMNVETTSIPHQTSGHFISR